MDIDFRRRFAITHYFNPVRYMRLLELVEGEDTDADIMARLKDMNDRVLGKGVVQCRDTPGFLGTGSGFTRCRWVWPKPMIREYRLNMLML
jgi:3-hydroxyacyl-CoA dehydrogenase